MGNIRAFFKSKSFFIYAMLIHIVLSVIIVKVSWEHVEPRVYDHMVRDFTAHKTGSDDIVVIMIDDKSLGRYQWPWKREIFADIFEYLHQYAKPKVMGFDAVVATLQDQYPESDKKFFNTVSSIDNYVAAFMQYTSEYEDEAGFEYDKKFKEKFSIKITDKRKKIPPSLYHSIVRFPAEYFNAVKYSGHIDVTPAIDGSVKYANILSSTNGTIYPSFPLRMYLLANGTDEITIYKNSVFVPKTGLKIPIPSFQPITGRDLIPVCTHYYKRHKNSCRQIRFKQ